MLCCQTIFDTEANRGKWFIFFMPKLIFYEANFIFIYYFFAIITINIVNHIFRDILILT
jgi:hypothetical protein